MKKFILEVQEDPETKESIITFPDEFLSEVGWKEGTVLNWHVSEEGNCVYLSEKKNSQ